MSNNTFFDAFGLISTLFLLLMAIFFKHSHCVYFAFISLCLYSILKIIKHKQHNDQCCSEQRALMGSLNVVPGEIFYIQFVKNGYYHKHKFFKDKLLVYDIETHRYILAPQSTTFKLIYAKKNFESISNPVIITFFNKH